MKINLSENSYCMTNDIEQKYSFRYQLLCQWFEKEGLKPPKKIISIENSKVNACTNGHIKVLQHAIKENLPYVIVFEDDAKPCINVIDKFNKYLKELEDYNIDWGILSIGRAGDTSGWNATLKELKDNNTEAAKKFNTLEGYSSAAKYISPNLFTIQYGLHGSHSYIVKKEYFQLAIDRFHNHGSIAADFTMTWEPLKLVCTKECLFLQKNADRFCVPKFYNINFAGPVDRTAFPIPIGFEP